MFIDIGLKFMPLTDSGHNSVTVIHFWEATTLAPIYLYLIVRVHNTGYGTSEFAVFCTLHTCKVCDRRNILVGLH